MRASAIESSTTCHGVCVCVGGCVGVGVGVGVGVDVCVGVGRRVFTSIVCV